MAETMTPQERLEIIRSNLQEVNTPEMLEDIVIKQGRAPVIYWGTATTGRPHAAYFVAMLKIASFLRAGCRVKILLADVHGFLDNLKAPIDLVKYRAEYYKLVITALLEAIGVPVDKLEFVLGSSYQLTQEYQMDLFRLCTIVTIHDAKKAGAEVVKQVENATLSGLIYPLMQALDEEYLKVDAQFGGVDQRKIFMLAKDLLPKVGMKERLHLMNPMVPGLTGGKMSASDPESKIDVLDDAAAVTKKIKKAFAAPKQIEDNGLLSFVEFVLLPLGVVRGGKPRFEVERREGQPLVYETIEAMQDDYKKDVLTPQLLKSSVTKALNDLLAPIQARFRASKEWQDIEQLAYPPPPTEQKKQRKMKDKGTRNPKNVEASAQPDGSVANTEPHATVNVGQSAQDALKRLSLGNKAVQNGNAQ